LAGVFAACAHTDETDEISNTAQITAVDKVFTLRCIRDNENG